MAKGRPDQICLLAVRLGLLRNQSPEKYFRSSYRATKTFLELKHRSTMATTADVLRISILGTDSIHVGFHLLPYIFHTVLSTLPSSTYALVTDSNISSIYLGDIRSAFDRASQDVGSSARFLVYEVSPGEGAKSRKVKEGIEDWLLDNRCTRDTVMVAFGGGVIGDLTGFVAATL